MCLQGETGSHRVMRFGLAVRRHPLGMVAGGEVPVRGRRQMFGFHVVIGHLNRAFGTAAGRFFERGGCQGMQPSPATGGNVAEEGLPGQSMVEGVAIASVAAEKAARDSRLKRVFQGVLGLLDHREEVVEVEALA